MSQRERSETTQGKLVAAARELFATVGYPATALGAVSEKAGVTKGALYHHYDGKPALFRAVFEAEQRALARTVKAAAEREPDPWDGFYAGCRAFFEASLVPDVQRITLLDAPSVLDWSTMREIEGRHGFALMCAGLTEAMRTGRIGQRPVEPLARMLHGALCEAAMYVARAEDQQAANDQVLRELRRLMRALADRG